MNSSLAICLVKGVAEKYSDEIRSKSAPRHPVRLIEPRAMTEYDKY